MLDENAAKRDVRNMLHTLNHITVEGKENLDRLLGCILVGERVLMNLQDIETTTTETVEVPIDDHHDEPGQDVHG